MIDILFIAVAFGVSVIFIKFCSAGLRLFFEGIDEIDGR